MGSMECQRCWPKLCRCPPETNQLIKERFEAMKQLDAEVLRRQKAEAVIRRILEAHSEGELSLPSVVADCQGYVKSI